MKRKIVGILVTGMIMASLAGCGTKTEATEQVPDSSNVVVNGNRETTETEVIETEVEIENDVEEVAGEFIGAEDENIVLYAEIEKYGKYFELYTFNFEDTSATVDTSDDVSIYNGDGIEVGYIKAGATIPITETATDGAWARFENPIANTNYDYLYVLDTFAIASESIRLNADSMKQRIVDRVLNSPIADEVDYTFLDEKETDMEVYECNLQSIYSDELDYKYWIDEELTRNFDMFDYQTLYVECEEDTDGWITVRLYYKDKINWNEH